MSARVSQTAAPGERLEDGEPDDQQEVVVRRRNRRREEVDQPNGDDGEHESGRIGSHPGRQRPRSRRPARGEPAKTEDRKGTIWSVRITLSESSRGRRVCAPSSENLEGKVDENSHGEILFQETLLE